MDALYWLAVAIGAGYWPGSDLPLPPMLLIVWKGSGVALLALWAALQARSRDGWLLAALLGCGAAGDVLIEIAGLKLGAAAFLLGHLIAIALYLRHQRGGAWSGVYLAVGPVVIGAMLLAPDRATAAMFGLYALGLAAMAAAAAASRFVLAGVGAWLFVASDLLIFAQTGPLENSFFPDLLIWPLYFAGQALIARSVARGLSRSGGAPALRRRSRRAGRPQPK